MTPLDNTPVPPRQELALASYLQAIKGHRLVVALVTLATVCAAVAFLALRSAEYEATAEILVQPVPQDDQVYAGLTVVRDTGDPARTAQTAASLVDSQAAGARTLEVLDRSELGGTVEVNPQGESNILAIEATAEDPDESARIANEFARAALAVRAEELGGQATDLIAELEPRLRATPNADQVTRANLAARLDRLRSVVQSGDPTLSFSQEALAGSPTGTSAMLIVILAALAGFALGSGAALLLELFARRVRDEDDALALYPLPVLARVPELPRRRRKPAPGSLWHMPPEVLEPFRTLAVQFDERGGQGAVMVTSPTAGDGKTTSAINLACALAATGKKVVLLDFDLRKPELGNALGLERASGFMDLMDAKTSLDGLLQPVSDVWSIRVLAIEPEIQEAGNITGMVDLAAQRLPKLLAEARGIADYVVVDTAPLGEVGDALRLVREVDDIVLLVRPGNTNRAQLEMLRDLLERADSRPRGFIVLGRAQPLSHGYYGYGQARAMGAPSESDLLGLESAPVGPAAAEQPAEPVSAAESADAERPVNRAPKDKSKVRGAARTVGRKS